MSVAETEALNKVRRRTGAIAFLAITIHGVWGLIEVAHVLNGNGRHSDAVSLVVMSGVVALLIVLATRAILGVRVWSWPWAVAAWLPAVAALIWIV